MTFRSPESRSVIERRVLVPYSPWDHQFAKGLIAVTLRSQVQAAIDVMGNYPQYGRPRRVNRAAEAHGAGGPRFSEGSLLGGWLQ
jgi:hypothetical protein